MARQKAASAQEHDKDRRERTALVPPGLFNHGNTCFMNSVVQGLIATQYLQLLVHFQPVLVAAQSQAIPIASRRSPVLTNGHGLAHEHEQPWSNALPIGDQLVALLRSAWDIQNNRRRENMSPKDLLSALGKKYDQYLDFRQQDAHEFLCQLLDAIRMEEIDIIKQRSPPKKKPTKRSQPPRPPPPKLAPHADDELLSFVDMLFGGKLASILVCQACKHVSHTYEDFCDLSLSIKPEDYVRERKRDKLKQFAKRIGTAFYVATPQQRSSSVPATPVRDARLDGPEADDPQRRRSIDLADVEIVVQPVDAKPDPGGMTKDDSSLQVPPSPVPGSPSVPGTPTDGFQSAPASDPAVPTLPHDSHGDHITIVAPEKVNGKGKDKDESWAKLGRRISVSVGLAKRSKGERKDGKATPTAALSRLEGAPLHHVNSAPVTANTVNGVASPYPHLEREPTSLGLVNERLQAQLTNVKRSVTPIQRSGNSPSGSSAPRFPLISRPSSPGTHSRSSKPPRAPKLSAEEAAYLRDILADISSPNVQKPFSLFRQSKDPSSSTFYPQSVFLKVNQINKIEECLRLFTSVEVLDGDNTVRCHRCWKIANGFYEPRVRRSAQEPDSCSDSEDDVVIDIKGGGDHLASSSISADAAAPVVPRSPSRPTMSLRDTQIIHDTPSTLTQHPTPSSSAHKPIPPVLQLNDGNPIEPVSPIKNETPTQRELTLPSISMTAPESPMSIQTPRPVPIRGNTMSSILTQTSTTTERSSRISLSALPDQQRRHGSRSGDSNTESEISEAESETLLSVYSDISSAPSSNPSPNASQDHLPQPSPTHSTHSKDRRHPSGVPRSRQYLLRPAYKRYLIATPPPVLVVHLKRFQQLSKAPVVSFSTGFKKLDDYISFPEHLDLGPYLAPKREDYFDSKVAVTRGRSRRSTPCMYRLYAVVVHIGNMLGGHYVAYTALPPLPAEAEVVRSDGEKQRSDNGTATREWAFISDTVVRLSSLEEVLKSKAYICMYERI